jgi:hypothetical protein
MADIHTNEREFQGQVVSWLNQFISAGGTPFDQATAETSLTGDVRGFTDVILWLNRDAKDPFCLMELKTPETYVKDSVLLKDALRKARALPVQYFVTWNMQELIVWGIKEEGREYAALPKRYPTLDMIQTSDDWTVDYKRRALETLCKELLEDLAWLQRHKQITRIPLDATFFVGRLHKAAETLYPYFEQTLENELTENKALRESITAWGKEQGITDALAQPRKVSRQTVYRLLCRIIFYEAVRSKYSQLDALVLAEMDPVTAQRTLREYFARAKNIDWYAVFEEELIDELPWPTKSVPVITDLLNDLEAYSFRTVPQDVIGKVFEQLIPAGERHGLGQYFTPENLVDFILAFCIQTANDATFDPTCGTGTFLIRGYDRLDYLGNHDHRKRLKQLWGNDIAHFPAALATINLFGQELGDIANFPRIIPPRDFFDIRPGDVFRFPLPTGPTEALDAIDEKLPEFESLVGNFPYIMNKNIANKGKIADVLNLEWPGSGDRLSGKADIFASMFLHAATFLKPGARLGFVTSNAWLDSAYGYELQRFFLDKFKIVAVVESRCEPWFEEASVNTVFTILERCEDAAERDDHLAKFVKVRRRLNEVFAQDPKLKQRERWQGLEGRARAIEHAGDEFYKIAGERTICTLKGMKSYQNGDFRIRVKTQRELREEIEIAGHASKWGKYLRGPDFYFDIKETLKDKIKPFSDYGVAGRGKTTGINRFFYLSPEEAKEKNIENEYLIPVFKSPKHSSNILLEPTDLKVFLFACKETKESLKKKKHYGALRYIEDNETKRSGVYAYPNVPSVQGNKPGWWAVKDLELAQIFCLAGYDTRLVVFFSPVPIGSDKRLYYIKTKTDKNSILMAAVLNSTLVRLFLELIGHLSQGDGVLGIHVEDINEYLEIPDIDSIPLKQKNNIIYEFERLIKRKIGPTAKESKERDRRALDSGILTALGLDPKKYLEPLYDSVVALVKERLELPRQRNKLTKDRVVKNVSRVKSDVAQEFLPQGFKPFPDAYVTYDRGDSFKTQSLGRGPCKLGAPFMGGREVLDRDGKLMARALSEEEAKFIAYSCQPDVYAVKIPTTPIKVHNAVVTHEAYLNDIYEQIFKALRARLQSSANAERFTAEIFEERGVPLIFFRT